MNKRKKVTRHRGTHTHGRGAKKKARGKGHRGGIGKSGTGKRGDQKKTLITKKYGGKYFGKSKVRRAAVKKELKIITLNNIKENLTSLVNKKLAQENKGVYELNLNNYKIIGNSDVGIRLKITAFAASKGAQEAVKNAGGEIIVKNEEEEKIKTKPEKEEYSEE